MRTTSHVLSLGRLSTESKRTSHIDDTKPFVSSARETTTDTSPSSPLHVWLLGHGGRCSVCIPSARRVFLRFYHAVLSKCVLTVGVGCVRMRELVGTGVCWVVKPPLRLLFTSAQNTRNTISCCSLNRPHTHAMLMRRELPC